MSSVKRAAKTRSCTSDTATSAKPTDGNTMSKISCFHPGCQDDIDEKAYDEKFGQFVAFCADHVPEWEDVDHIDFDPYTEQA